jgi:uncharacterized protein (AIM24 family)
MNNPKSESKKKINSLKQIELSNSKKLELYNKMINKSSSKSSPKSVSKKNSAITINLGENYKEITDFDNTKITFVQNPNILKNHNFPSFKYIGNDGFMSVQFDLKKDEAIRVNNGMLNFMDSNIETVTKTNSIWKGLMRKLSGSSFYFNLFTNTSTSEVVQRLNLSGPFIGNIYAFYIPPHTKFYTIESSYVCSTPNVDITTKFKLGGLITGYGVTYVKAKTNDTAGLLWLSSFGPIVPMIIKPNESIKFDNGILLGFGENITMNTRLFNGVKGLFFSGEGLVTEIKNESKLNEGKNITIYLQSKSLYSFANYISSSIKSYSLISATTKHSTIGIQLK